MTTITSSLTATTATLPTRKAFQEWLLDTLAEHLCLARDNMSPRNAFITLGLSAVEAKQICEKISQYLGKEVSTSLLYSYPTVANLSEYLIDNAEANALQDNAATAILQSLRTVQTKAQSITSSYQMFHPSLV